MRRFFAMLFVFYAFSFAAVNAEEWKSDDGLFSFTVPESYVEDKDQPLLQFHLRHWKTKDYRGFMMVGKSLIPPGVPKVSLEAFTEGIRQNTFTPDRDGNPPPDVEVAKSESGETKEGFVYYDVTIAGHNSAWRMKQYSRHYAVFVNGTIYKLVFTVLGQNPVELPDINECVASVNVHATPDPPPALVTVTDWEDARLISGPLRYVLIGMMSVLILVLVVSVLRRVKSS